MSFLERMAAAEAIAARYQAGEIDYDTAAIAILIAWEGTLAEDEAAVRNYLNTRTPDQEGSRP